MHKKYHKYNYLIKQEVLHLLSTYDIRFLEKLKFLEILKYMLKHNLKKTKREIFYASPKIFKSQQKTNTLISFYLKKWDTEMYDLNITISLKGVFSGTLEFKYEKDTKILKEGLIPDINEVEEIICKYKSILIIEKDSMLSFISCLFKEADENQNFLMISGKGYPCTNTKLFLKKLANTNPNIKFYGLFDFDPFGIDIYRDYKKIINIIRIGINSEDIFYYKVNESEMLELNSTDYSKIKSLEKYEEFKEDLLFLKGLRKKCEIEIFTSFDKNFIKKYLKRKIQ